MHLVTLTDSTRTTQWTDAAETNYDQRFHRAAALGAPPNAIPRH